MSPRSALLPAIALATAAQSAPRDVPAATTVGDSRSCVPLHQIRATRVRDDRTIDFVMAGGTVYRNTLPDACPELGFERAFSYATSLSQLCSVDIISVVRSGGSGSRQGASCGLGRFQPVGPARPGR